MWYITRISRVVHDMIFKDTSESLCSRAWRLQDQSRFWRIWTYVFGRLHCYDSYNRYWVNPLDQTDRHQSR
jgi:hypothetical protein